MLEGPGAFTLESGSVEVLGYELSPGARVIVPVGRRVPARVVEPSNASYTVKVHALDPEFYERVDRLAGEIAGSYERLIIVGPSDAGKSTLAAWIINKWLGQGRDPLYATVDVGQNENYSPGFASSSIPEGVFVPGGPSRLYRACFVGSFTPRDALGEYLACGKRVVDGWEGPVVVDTDGWVTPWEGAVSKAALSSILGADAVAVVGSQSLADYLSRVLGGAEVIRLDPLVSGAGKGRGERRAHRERLLAKVLAGGREHGYNVARVPVYGAPVFRGDPLDPSVIRETVGVNAIYAERVGDSIVVVARARQRGPPGVSILRAGWERGLLAGLHYSDRVSPGLVTRINYRRRTLYILTREEEPPEYIIVGRARVDPGGFLGNAKW